MNCPALISTQYQCLCFQNRHIDCQQVNNCIIKQVIEKCKVVYDTERMNRYKTNGFILANDILQLFNIER